MSHVRVWRDMVEKGREFALVTEDDVRLVPNFKTKLDDLLDEANEHPWDIINIGPIWPVVRNDISPGLYEAQSLGTHAYLITLQCARKLAVFEPKLMKSGIDFLLNRFPLETLCAKDILADQGDAASKNGFLSIKSMITGDIGMNRTMDYEFLVRFGFQRLKPFIILLVLLIIF